MEMAWYCVIIKTVLKPLLVKEVFTIVSWNLFWFSLQMCLCNSSLILACKTFHCSLALCTSSPGSVYLNELIILLNTTSTKGTGAFVQGRSIVKNQETWLFNSTLSFFFFFLIPHLHLLKINYHVVLVHCQVRFVSVHAKAWGSCTSFLTVFYCWRHYLFRPLGTLNKQ